MYRMDPNNTALKSAKALTISTYIRTSDHCTFQKHVRMIFAVTNTYVHTYVCTSELNQ